MYSRSRTPTKDKLGGNFGAAGFLARPRMGALKNLYTSLNSKYSKQFGGHDKKKRTKKQSPTPKMEYIRKKPDYADTAYREAVGRLRILLAESYSPRRRTMARDLNLNSGGEETDNQSVISIISRTSKYPIYSSMPYRKYMPVPKLSTDSEKRDRFATSPELSAFMERQEDYIEQLERESRFSREELATLLSKVKEVIQENEALHDKQKDTLMKSVFEQFETETETDTDLIKPVKLKSPRRRVNLEGPSIMFESRISELEAQLTQAKIDLKKSQEDNETCRRKHIGYGDNSSDMKKQFETLQNDKSLLQDTVTKLQAALNTLRDKELSSTDQVKRSLDIAEQAQYEKNAGEHEIRRLKDELERQHGKLRDAINEQSRRVADERASVERRYTQQIEQLSSELGVHWEQTNKLNLELDKQRRDNADKQRELVQKQAQIDELRKEMQTKIITLQSDIGVSGAEKSALEQQIATLHMSNERFERQGKQDSARLQVEMQSLRQRLDRADADLIHSRRENLRLTEQIAALEKEINMNAALADEKNKIIALPPPKQIEEKEKDETACKIDEIETKHAATVAGLEGMIQSQNQLMDKLSAECHALTLKLEESSAHHKVEIRELQTNLEYLSSKFSQSQNPIINDSSDGENDKRRDSILSQQISPQQTQNLVENQENEHFDDENSQQNQEYYQSEADPNAEQYQQGDYQYPEGQYDEQQYMTQEQYDQQYGQYDPNQVAAYEQDQLAQDNEQMQSENGQVLEEQQQEQEPQVEEQPVASNIPK